jgi:DNA-binding XRE family transcriptional regulator
MNVTIEKSPYEVLIRFRDDGTVSGAHVAYLETPVIDGRRMAPMVSPAEPLSLENFPNSDIMTQTQLAAFAEVSRLSQKLGETENAFESEKDQNERLTKALSVAQFSNTKLALEVANLKASLAAATEKAEA